MTITAFRIIFISFSDYDREQFADNQIPLLVIGTKLDQIPETKRNEVLTRTAFLAEDFNAEEINLVSILVTSVFLLYGSDSDFLLSKTCYKNYSSRDFLSSAGVVHILIS